MNPRPAPLDTLLLAVYEKYEALAKEIVHQHKGKLLLADAPQGGAVFPLALPLTQDL